MKTQDITDLILPIGMLFLAYTGLNRLLPGQKTSSAVSSSCPRGSVYQRSLGEGCDPNYRMDFFTLDCSCLTSLPTSPNPFSCHSNEFWDSGTQSCHLIPTPGQTNIPPGTISPGTGGSCPSGSILIADRQDLVGAYCQKVKVNTSNPLPSSGGSAGFGGSAVDLGGGTYTNAAGQNISRSEAQKLGVID